MANSEAFSLRVLVCSYNLPKETEAIYEKLLRDGFDRSDIIVIDNGSDKFPPASCANFKLPFNIRFTGQARMGLDYLMDYFPASHYWLISTSTILSEKINYRESLYNAVSRLQTYQPAILGHSFEKDQEIYRYIYKTPEERQRYESQFSVQSWSEEKTAHKAGLIDGWLQLISTVFTHDLLEEARRTGSGFWNRDLYRGWGIAAELIYVANRMGKCALVLYDSHVTWVQNKTYRENKDVESIEEYRKKASAEEKAAFEKRYGRNAYLLFRSWFLRSASKFDHDTALYRDFRSQGIRQKLQVMAPRIYSRWISRFI